MKINEVWVLKYRPKTIEDVLMAEDDHEFFKTMEAIPNNMLFVGAPGTGKTTTAKLLAEKFSPNSYLFIKASENGNIDTVRTLISDFISVLSIDGRPKVVILDEACGISRSAQDALRSVMEEYLDQVKFILTANYRNKLIHALRSRCKEFNFNCSQKQVLQRIVKILKAEDITVPKEQFDNIRTLVKETFPDIRKTIHEFQHACQTGTFVYKKTATGVFAKEVAECLKQGMNVFDIREKVVNSTDQFGNDYHSLMKDLFNHYVRERNVVATLLISEYMFRHTAVLDTEINFSALLFNLKQKIQ